MLGNTGDSYTPLITEIITSLGIISVASLVFLFAIENFNICGMDPKEPGSLPHTMPEFDYSSRTWLGTPDVTNIAKHSLAFIHQFCDRNGFDPG